MGWARGVTFFLMVVFAIQSAGAYYVIKDTYQAEAPHHAPIVFIPGVMGTILGEDIGGGIIDEAWPGLPHEDRLELGFEDDGETPLRAGTEIIPTATLRSVFGVKPIYQGFFTYMDAHTDYTYRGQDGDTGFLRKAYFDHPYDFRLHTDEHLKRGEHSLLDRIDEILRETRSNKVILVAHSMGGLQARIFANKHRKKVAGIVFLSNPHNGAPRGFESLTQGYNFGAGLIVTENHVWQMGHNWPGIYHLMPNKPFVRKDDELISLDDTYDGDYISFQQSNNIPDAFMAEMYQEGVTDPDVITERIKTRFRGISEDIAADTKAFREDFDPLGIPSEIPFVLINGDGQNTTYEFEVTEEVVSRPFLVGERQTGRGKVPNYQFMRFKIWNFNRVDELRGDETVDRHGLTWNKASTIRWVQESHMNVPSNREAMNWAMGFIEEINHDKRDEAWVNKLESIAFRKLANLRGISEEAAIAQTEEYKKRLTAATAGDSTRKNGNYISRLMGDIRGRGKYVFFHRLIDGQVNNINIVVPGAGEYQDEPDFKAWLALDGYFLIDSGIGEVQPGNHKVTMKKQDFLDLMNGDITFEEAWEAGKIDAGVGAWFADWIAGWVRSYG